MARKVSTAKLAPVKLLCVFIVALLSVVGLLHLRGYSDQLPTRSLTLSKATVSAVDTYDLNFSLGHPQGLGSILLTFCQEDPLVGNPCTTPPGMNTTGVTITSQSGETGFTASTALGGGTVLLTRPLGLGTTSTNLHYELSGILNPSTSGTFYARLQTFATTNGTGPDTDESGLALSINDVVTVSAVVPPYLYFCVGVQISGTDCLTASGNYINFGDFTTVLATTAQTQMVAGTNGPTGYAIAVGGTTLTSGINTIPPLTVADVSRPGTSQFGMNLVANTDPTVGENPSGGGAGAPTAGYNTANSYKFNPGDIVASNAVPDLPRKYTASYIANIAKAQEPGIYVSTLTYVATAGF